MRPLRHLLFATLEDSSNPGSWSGIPFSLRHALETRLERVSVLDKLPVRRSLHHGGLRAALGPKRWPLWATDPALKQFGSSVQAALDQHKPDALLSISSQCLIYSQPTVPTAMFADAPWLAWKEAYREFESTPLNGAGFAKKEALAARKCQAILFSSQWAVDQGRALYGLEEERFHIAPLGATWVPQMPPGQLDGRIAARGRDTVRLLFVGRDWERKGGPLAVRINRLLNQLGLPSHLDIVGCRPEIAPEDLPAVTIHGLLRRDDARQSEQLHSLFLDSSFLVVPTSAECFGIVFAEAAAHGLPVVSRRVQALPYLVKDNQTGILEAPDIDAEPYARRILAVFRDQAQYVAMAHAARQRYEQNFTWDHCAQRIISALERYL